MPPARPVAIVVPRLAATVVAGSGARRQDARGARALRRPSRSADRTAEGPRERRRGGADRHRRRDPVGAVAAAARRAASRAADAAEFLHIAAVASLTEVAIEEAQRGGRGEPPRLVPRGRARARRTSAPREIVRRAGPAGLRPRARRRRALRGAEHRPPAPRRRDRSPATTRGAGPAHGHRSGGPGRVYALLPAVGADDAPEVTLERARTLADRLGRHGKVGLSSFYTDPAELPRAMQEAELVLDVLRQLRGRRRRPRRHRHRHLPAAVPRARLASRGGARLLRGHRRADRPLRRPVPHRPRRRRSRPTSSRTAT